MQGEVSRICFGLLQLIRRGLLPESSGLAPVPTISRSARRENYQLKTWSEPVDSCLVRWHLCFSYHSFLGLSELCRVKFLKIRTDTNSNMEAVQRAPEKFQRVVFCGEHHCVSSWPVLQTAVCVTFCSLFAYADGTQRFSIQAKTSTKAKLRSGLEMLESSLFWSWRWLEKCSRLNQASVVFCGRRVVYQWQFEV